MEDAIALGAALETAVLFLSLALTVNVAVYGWLGALGAWSGKEADRGEREGQVLLRELGEPTLTVALTR